MRLKNFLKTTTSNFSSTLLSTIIRANVHLREASILGKSIFEHNPRSRGAADFDLLAKELSSRVQTIKTVEFKCAAPESSRVYLVGDFTGWQKRKEYAMIRKNQAWQKRLSLERGKYRYKFIVDERWVHDRTNPLVETDPYGGYNSLINIDN